MTKGKRRMLIIYHAGCADGFCAAWILKKAFPNSEFHAARYGSPLPPQAKGQDSIVVADFCYPLEQMEQLIRENREVVVLDHHKTAKEILEKISESAEVIFDLNKSGARLVWEHLFGSNTKSPWLVDYTEDRDLWRWRLPNSREINAALRSYSFDFETWDRMDRGSSEKMIPEGQAILRREKQIIDDHVRHASEIEIDGHKILIINATVLASEIAGALAVGRPFGAVYYDTNDGIRRFSLRSDKNGVDVSEVAKKYGGGGHANAAGFETKL